VGQALGRVLEDRFETLRQRHAEEAAGTVRRALENPSAYDLNNLKAPQRTALTRFWESWQDELASIKVLDPACGSGAFLIEAFEQLYTAYEQSNDRLQELRRIPTPLFDLDRHILQHNLYGVDLNEEAIQICRLSLWIKTARRGKVLTSLDHSIRVGNSIIADPELHPKAFDWKVAFPEVFERGGFDVVIGNPPYVRQEWIGPYKAYLQTAYKTFHGTADLYVYFYEVGIRVLRPGGRLSFVVTNKWLKAAYGEPLRRFFVENTWVESIVDFGHAKQIFEDADVFPSIIVVQTPMEGSVPPITRVCAIPREQLRINDLTTQIETQGFDVENSHLSGDAWTLEPKVVMGLLTKLRSRAIPLADYTGTKPYRGILTGFNEGFLITTQARNDLVAADPACADIIRPYLRGQDVKRWYPDWAGLWMIILKSSGDCAWPWSAEGERAEDVFRQTYPSLYGRMKPLQEALTKRQDRGRHWWELRSCAYWHEFEKPKLVYQEIQFHPSYTLDSAGQYGNNKTFFIAVGDLYLLSVLNSPLLWWHNWRFLPHMKDEALSPVAFLMEKMPIASPTDDLRFRIETSARRLIETATSQQRTRQDVVDWLKVEYEITEPSTKLLSPIELDSDHFIAEVRKLRGRKNPLSLAALRSLREEHGKTIVPAQILATEAQQLEQQVSDLVNSAYGLTPEEVQLMWETAPPRMPIAPPRSRM
jgi:SAM-dependent methyltransferase